MFRKLHVIHYANYNKTKPRNIGKNKWRTNTLLNHSMFYFDVSDVIGKGHDLLFNINVNNSTGQHDSSACGFSFTIKQYFGESFNHVAQCSYEDYKNGTYSAKCNKHYGKCTKLTIMLDYMNFEAFLEHPKIIPLHYTIKELSMCSKVNIASKAFNWEINNSGKCERLFEGNNPVSLTSDDMICSHLKTYSDVYIVGPSHLRFFADYIMHKCYGRNMTKISPFHDDLTTENIHFVEWRYMDQINKNFHTYLPEWTKHKKSIAVWLQTGSSEFSNIGFDIAMDKLPLLQKTLIYIKAFTMASGSHVDLRVLGTPPMPDGWFWNNHAIAHFNAKQRGIVQELNIDFTDLFELQVPCYNDTVSQYNKLTQTLHQGNHYLQRLKFSNTFVGEVGRYGFLGRFFKDL